MKWWLENSNPGGTLNVIKLGSCFLPWVVSKAFQLQISGEHSKPKISVLIRFGTGGKANHEFSEDRIFSDLGRKDWIIFGA